VNNDGWTNEELIGYCDIHLEAPRALFHIGHVKRMLCLAGMSELAGQIHGEWHSLHEDMQQLVKLARARLPQNVKRLSTHSPRCACGEALKLMSPGVYHCGLCAI
jgi:hypothetical protein